MKWIVIAILACIVSNSSHAESGGNHTTGTNGTTATNSAPPTGQNGGNRPAVEVKLSDREVALLSEGFSMPSEVIKARYGKSLPDAIEKAMKGNEDDSAKVMAELMGTLNNSQFEKLMKKVADEKKSESAKETNRDNKYLALLDRIEWAGKILKEEPSKEANAQQFNEKFAGAMKTIKEMGETIKAKAKDAIAGNQEAKKFLRETLNRQALMSFIDGQRKSGNEKFANELADAISWSSNGQKFIDMFNPKNESDRLYLGTTQADLGKALAAYSNAKDHFTGATLAKDPHANPQNEFVVGNNGALANGRPAGINVTNTPPPREGQNNNNNGNTGGNNNGNTGGNNPPPSSGGGGFEAIRAAFSDGKCTNCHGGTLIGTDVKTARFKKDGKEFTMKETVAAIERISAMKTKIPADVQSKIKSFASQQ